MRNKGKDNVYNMHTNLAVFFIPFPSKKTTRAEEQRIKTIKTLLHQHSALESSSSSNKKGNNIP